jgi:hypothetical protein
MYRLMVAAAMTIGIANQAASQVGLGDLPVVPCTFDGILFAQEIAFAVFISQAWRDRAAYWRHRSLF